MEVRVDYGVPSGKVGHNVLHARYPSAYPGSIAMANALKTAIASAYTSSGLVPQLSNNLFLNAVAVRDLGVLNAPYLLSTSAASVIGSDIAQALPSEVAAALTSRTAVSGPGGRGRVYITGFTTTGLGVGNVILAGVVTNLTAFGAALMSAINGQSVTMCLALKSRVGYTGKTGTVHPPRVAGTADITQIICRDNHWDSQRRRGLK